MRHLIVMTYAGAEEVCKRHWPTWLHNSGAEHFIFAGGDKPFWVPGIADAISCGQDAYPTTSRVDLNMPRRLVDAVGYTSHDGSVAIIEPDVVIARELPWPTNRLDVRAPLFVESDGRQFVHWPLIMGEMAAQLFYKVGKKLLKYGATCMIYGGFPDRFAGMVTDLVGDPVDSRGFWSVNTIHSREDAIDARRAVDAGAYAVHGVKTAEAFNIITQ